MVAHAEILGDHGALADDGPGELLPSACGEEVAGDGDAPFDVLGVVDDAVVEPVDPAAVEELV